MLSIYTAIFNAYRYEFLPRSLAILNLIELGYTKAQAQRATVEWDKLSDI